MFFFFQVQSALRGASIKKVLTGQELPKDILSEGQKTTGGVGVQRPPPTRIGLGV